jgi:acyl-CoA synthetase (AMP-forming)/AMP-acid ligase II
MNRDIFSLLENSKVRNGEKIFIWDNDINITYNDFYEYAVNFGSFLKNLSGINRGDRIGILLKNHGKRLFLYLVLIILD